MPQLFTLDGPRWAQMWVIAACMYTAAKLMTWHRESAHDVPRWRVAAYFLAWPGMDATAFLTRADDLESARCRAHEWRGAIVKLALGMVVLYGAARFVPADQEYLIGWLGGAGLLLTLHFGAFHLLSCAWRQIGFGARPLMNRPLLATSVSDFWGRRWNTAFRDLAHSVVFRPLAARFGNRFAALTAFMVSGIVHDLAISVPAHGGYGRPTLYFAIQGAAVTIERSHRVRHHLGSTGWPTRVVTAVVLLAPAPLLFHRPFLVGVIVPFMRAIGAL